MSGPASGTAVVAPLADLCVRVAVRLLPSAARERYRSEFRAELHGRTARQQTRSAASLLLHILQLRSAIAMTSSGPSVAGVPVEDTSALIINTINMQ